MDGTSDCCIARYDCCDIKAKKLENARKVKGSSGV